MTIWTRSAFVIAFSALVAGGTANAADDGKVVYSTTGDFETVALDVSNAIINRGYVIDYTARIGEMLDRTAADVGATETVFANAQIAQFCSAVLSRKVMEAEPENIAFCPYSIFYYELDSELGTVYVGYRPLEGGATDESREALEEVNALLEDIVREVTDAQ